MNNKTTKILLADDYGAYWEMYETTNKEQLIREAAAILNERGNEIDTTTSKIICTSEDNNAPEWGEIRSQADEIIYTSELYDDDNDDKYLPF